MIPNVRYPYQRVIEGNAPVTTEVFVPTHNLASGVAPAGTGLRNEKPSLPTESPINAVTGVPVAGTTTGPITVGTEPSLIKNSLPDIIPRLGSNQAKATGWLIVLAAIAAMAGVYTA